jgi:sulfur-oxidizing protein SoxA
MKWVAVVTLGAAAAWAEPPRSGSEFMSPQTLVMQRDDSQNPGMLWVQGGEQAWNAKPPNGKPACAACHGEARQSMRGVAARYPAFDAALGRPVALSERVNLCRERHQALPPLAFESEPLLALETYVAHQSRGLPMAPSGDARLAPFRERGERLFMQRIGQLNLSCAQCHDQSAGGRLGSSVIPQGHANGYPIYRLEWQTLGSLQRRLRNCMNGVRAEPAAFGSADLVALELYLAQRARGLLVETPAVRP